VPAEKRKTAYDLLRRELIAGSQSGILILIDRFWRDLSKHSKQPDMTPEMLLKIAVSP
jgi:hypothetical protein